MHVACCQDTANCPVWQLLSATECGCGATVFSIMGGHRRSPAPEVVVVVAVSGLVGPDVGLLAAIAAVVLRRCCNVGVMVRYTATGRCRRDRGAKVRPDGSADRTSHTHPNQRR